jgi:hypothetical protein
VNYNLRESGTDGTNIVSDPNNHLCTVSLLKYHIENNLPWYWTGLLFLKKATAKVLSLCKTMGITYIVDTDPSSSTDSTPRGKVGCSFLTSQVRKLAMRCNFEKALNFIGRSACCRSISKMATCGVASGEILGNSRHKSLHTNTVYQICNPETSDHQNSDFLNSMKQKPIKNKETSLFATPLLQDCNPTMQYLSSILQYPCNLVQYNAPVSIQNPYIRNNNSVNGTTTDSTWTSQNSKF